ncbi:MAG: hypothetical protein FWH46_03870, partial [Methanimicrococcus sp.]|nr:hypothetical protein [Methanimicrococcus sp.]
MWDKKTMISINKQNKLPLIECLILLAPLLVYTVGGILAAVFFPYLTNLPVALFYPICIVLILILNIIFYSILKKKYQLETDTFLYGVGFTSIWFTFLLLLLIMIIQVFNLIVSESRFQTDSLHYIFFAFHIIPITSLFYSYAALLKNNEKRIDRTTLYLTAITAVLFVLGIVICFLIMTPIRLFEYILLSFFGLYICYSLIYYAIYKKKFQLTLRKLAWIPALLAIVLYILSTVIALFVFA